MRGSGIPTDALVALVREAGDEILGWYGVPGEVEEKEDRTPLTAADLASHAHLVNGLSRLSPSIPVLSEESPSEALVGRKSWGRFWLVDPLDGTKEFLKGTGEFTVNVALIEEGRPAVGVVHVPALGSTYRASEDWGAQKAGEDGRFQSIHSRGFEARAPVLVGSRDHAGPAVERLATLLGPGMEFTSMGSSLKFCLVAEGRADLYLRDRPTKAVEEVQRIPRRGLARFRQGRMTITMPKHRRGVLTLYQAATPLRPTGYGGTGPR